MPYSTSDRRAAHDYSSLGLTAKLRVSHSTLKIGTLMPRLPVVQFNDTRLHPQTFQGGLLEVNEIDGLALQFGQLRQVKQRDSTNAEDPASPAATSATYWRAGTPAATASTSPAVPTAGASA